MTCFRTQHGFICYTDSHVDLSPYGANVWCEYHSWLGPLFTRKSGREITNPTKKMWDAFSAWRKTEVLR